MQTHPSNHVSGKNNSLKKRCLVKFNSVDKKKHKSYYSLGICLVNGILVVKTIKKKNSMKYALRVFPSLADPHISNYY